MRVGRGLPSFLHSRRGPHDRWRDVVVARSTTSTADRDERLDPDLSPVFDEEVTELVARPRRRPRFFWVAPLVGAYLGAWMVRRMWGSALIAGADSTAIATRTDRTIGEVLANGHLNGWS